MSKEQEQAKTETSEQAEVPAPMIMGMEMAKKMMAQMGKGGPSPMEMMQKKMAQMSQSQEGGPSAPPPPMMQMCMGMCSEMLTAIKRTTDMAAFATPELNHLFAKWLESLEEKAIGHLKEKGEADVQDLATALTISEESAAYLIAHLLQSGKVSARIQATQGDS